MCPYFNGSRCGELDELPRLLSGIARPTEVFKIQNGAKSREYINEFCQSYDDWDVCIIYIARKGNK
jgi:hypothetical protein